MNNIRRIIVLFFAVFSITSLLFGYYLSKNTVTSDQAVLKSQTAGSYWFLLHRKSNVEKLFQGVPGDVEQSKLVPYFFRII